MKALLDTCVVVDFLQKREPFAQDALSFFRAAALQEFSGYITAKSATDIFYLSHRATHSNEQSRILLLRLLDLVGMLDSLGTDVRLALRAECADFEDAVMIETAKRSGMDCIVTRNTKHYAGASIGSTAQAYGRKEILWTGRTSCRKSQDLFPGRADR